MIAPLLLASLVPGLGQLVHVEPFRYCPAAHVILTHVFPDCVYPLLHVNVEPFPPAHVAFSGHFVHPVVADVAVP